MTVKASCALHSPKSLDCFVLKVDIVSTRELGSPQHRVGDVARRSLGKDSLRPYVVIKCGSIEEQTPPLSSSSETVHLPLPRDVAGRPFQDLEVSFKVYDSRSVQSVIRGDPLIGEARISLGEESLGAPNIRTVCLTRRKTNARPSQHGTLTVRVGVIAPGVAYSVLAACANRPLAQVIKALSQILIQPIGVESLKRARPHAVTMPPEADEVSFGEMLQTWVIQLDACTRRLNGLEDDNTAVWHVAKVMQSLQQLVRNCLGPHYTELDAEERALEWLRCLIDQFVEGESASFDQVRLQRLVEAGSMRSQHVTKRLAAYGVYLPKGTGRGLEFVVLARLVEAEQSSEVDIFTGEQIVSNGKAARGLAMVLRPGNTSEGPRVYVYDAEGITRWYMEHGFDPTTREEIRSDDIIPLTVRPSLPKYVADQLVSCCGASFASWASRLAIAQGAV